MLVPLEVAGVLEEIMVMSVGIMFKKMQKTVFQTAIVHQGGHFQILVKAKEQRQKSLEKNQEFCTPVAAAVVLAAMLRGEGLPYMVLAVQAEAAMARPEAQTQEPVLRILEAAEAAVIIP